MLLHDYKVLTYIFQKCRN